MITPPRRRLACTASAATTSSAMTTRAATTQPHHSMALLHRPGQWLRDHDTSESAKLPEAAAHRRTDTTQAPPGSTLACMGSDARERFRVGFVAGVTPDRWARLWAERMPRSPLDLVPLADQDGVALLRSGDLDMCFVRLPVDRDGLHLIPLYDEQPVVVVAAEHPVAAYDEIDVAELADEHLIQAMDMDLRRAVERVAADAGVLVVPMSLARLHHRRDLTHVRVTGVPTTTVGLAWRVDAEGGGEDRIEAFIGVVRGRTANSSRGREAPRQSQGAKGTKGSKETKETKETTGTKGTKGTKGKGVTSRRAAGGPR